LIIWSRLSPTWCAAAEPQPVGGWATSVVVVVDEGELSLAGDAAVVEVV
jgi:hypothetical protein